MREGVLYVVATPIGNLEDISIRAIRILKEVDLVACEDTRTSTKLLKYYSINKPTISYHEHSLQGRSEYIINLLIGGKKIALLSESGTPTISDPGSKLVQNALSKGIRVSPVPGSSSVSSALSVSGICANQFIFTGFLPRKKTKRRKIIYALKKEKTTLVFFESPYRLLDTLKDLVEILGTRRATIGRELTKLYEEIKTGTLQELLIYFSQKEVKGEFTIVVEGAIQKSTAMFSSE